MNANEFKLEQYKQLITHISSLHSARESSNQFWIVINSIGLSAISYMKGIDTDVNYYSSKAAGVILFSLCIVLSILWAIALVGFKKNINDLYFHILKFEKNFESVIFAEAYNKELMGKTIKFPIFITEIFVPVCFFISYVLLGKFLIF